MADPFADPVDVGLMLGVQFTDSQQEKVLEVLANASARLRRRWAWLDDRVATDPVMLDAARQAARDMVVRVIRNPDGFKSETDGDYSYSIDTSVASGRLQITDNEMELLVGAQPVAVGSIRLKAGLAPVCRPWWT